jgi:protein CpxP
MKTFPKHLLTLAGLLWLAIPALRAADEPSAPAPGDQPKHERRERGPGGWMERAAQELGLTADQQASWKEIGRQERAALEPLRADTTLSKEERRAKAMEINQGFAEQRRAVLTADQLTKFDELRAELRTKMREHGDQQGPKKPKSS